MAGSSRLDLVVKDDGRPIAPAVRAAMDHLSALEDSLIDRSIAFAKASGYARYTTTIRAAWTEAVRSLTEALGEFLAMPRDGRAGPLADIAYGRDPQFALMRSVARKHRALGITLELYLGLFKHFRRVYLGALEELDLAPEAMARLRVFMEDFFDETELSVTADWTATGEDARLSELQARARSLTLTKDRYVAIFESLRHPAMLLDRERRLAHANQAAAELFVGRAEAGGGLYGQDRRELTGRIAEVLDGVLAPGSEAQSTAWIETRDGRRCFDVRERPLQDALENTSLGYLLQLYDVTPYRNEADEAQRAERQMSRFLATMSHEIRTPLHSVLGAVELLRLAETESRDAYLDVIQSAGQSLLQTLNNVLEFSKLGGGPPELHPTDVDMAAALSTFRDLATVGLDAGREMMTLEVDAGVPQRISIDWTMVRQVLANLVANALRYDDGLGVVLSVSCTPEAAGAPRLRFVVTDHGPGLPDIEALALELPFEEVIARHTADGGAGLGLAICRYLVEALGGDIGFRSSERGTRVWFDVPFERTTDSRAAKSPALPDERRDRGTCLLVDDDQIGARITANQLRRCGFSVCRAGSLRDARVALRNDNFDAIIVDYLLPDGIGPDLLDAPRKRHAPRFIALSANVEVLKESGKLTGRFHRLLAKPVDAATLSDALQGCGQSDASAPVTADKPGLQGLPPATVAAMIALFEGQWAEFRGTLEGLRRGEGNEDILREAHRLAGTTAQLGLPDLEAPLRELERRCRGRETAFSDLIEVLDRPLCESRNWRRLEAEAAET